MTKRGLPKMTDFEMMLALAVRAFGQGFVAGADPRRAVRAYNVEASTHEHWRRGFDAGREAISLAEEKYGEDLRRPARSTLKRGGASVRRLC